MQTEAVPATPDIETINPETGEGDLDAVITEPGHRLILGAHWSVAERLQRAYKVPFYLEPALTAARLPIGYVLATSGLWWEGADDKHPARIADACDVVLRESTPGLYLRCRGLLVKHVVNGEFRLTALPEPYLAGDGSRAIAKLKRAGLKISPKLALQRHLVHFLLNVRPIDFM